MESNNDESSSDNIIDVSPATEETTDDYLQESENGQISSPDQNVNGESAAAQISKFGTQQRPIIGGGSPIFRVPAHVRGVEKEAYTPNIVRIGPFHQNDQPNLRAFENQKMRFLARLQTRIKLDVEKAMKEMEEKTRKWYVEDFEDMKSDDFVRMMLLDGCFIVELLRLYTMKTSPLGNDVEEPILEQGNDVEEPILEQGNDVEEPILKTRWMVPNICRDLLLLENQLPMFVLRKIYYITTRETKSTTPLNELALRFFEPFRPGKDKLGNNMSKYTKRKYPHLLALFHSTFMNPNYHSHSHRQMDNNRNLQSNYDKIPGKGWVQNAKTLTYAGVQFEKKSGNFLDIEYKSRKLKIPTLFIDEGSSTLLRSLIAYEQSDGSATPYFSCLAVFLDSIVDTVDDINILRRAGIIKQAKGGDQEVVHLFNSLTKGVEIDMNECYIMKQIQDINSRCRSHEAMAKFRRFLAAVNFRIFNKTYISVIFTMISIWYIIKDHSPQNSPPNSPPNSPHG